MKLKDIKTMLCVVLALQRLLSHFLNHSGKNVKTTPLSDGPKTPCGFLKEDPQVVRFY
jgi:hypothetical protein